MHWERMGIPIAQTSGRSGRHYIIYLYIGETPVNGKLVGDVYTVWRDGSELRDHLYPTLAEAKAAAIAMDAN